MIRAFRVLWTFQCGVNEEMIWKGGNSTVVARFWTKHAKHVRQRFPQKYFSHKHLQSCIHSEIATNGKWFTGRSEAMALLKMYPPRASQKSSRSSHVYLAAWLDYRLCCPGSLKYERRRPKRKVTHLTGVLSLILFCVSFWIFPWKFFCYLL